MADNSDIENIFDNSFFVDAFPPSDTVPLEYDTTASVEKDSCLLSNNDLMEPFVPYENTFGIPPSIWTPTNYDTFLKPTEHLGQEEFAILLEKNEKLERYVHIRKRIH